MTGANLRTLDSCANCIHRYVWMDGLFCRRELADPPVNPNNGDLPYDWGQADDYNDLFFKWMEGATSVGVNAICDAWQKEAV